MTVYQRLNRRAWARLAHAGSESSQPFDRAQLRRSAEWLDPWEWIPWKQVRSVLCLASGGGQQAPSFAYLGYKTTLVDLSRVQMEVDRAVARRHGLEIEFIEADMLDLSSLQGRCFDLVYQPVSACYVPDVRRLYRQVARVLRPGGYYRVEHWNPYQMQLDPAAPWDGQGYRLVEPQGTREPVPLTWLLRSPNGQKQVETLCHYIHPLHDMIGGLCDAGFKILRYGERLRGRPDAAVGSYPHLRAHVPSFLAMFAQIANGQP